MSQSGNPGQRTAKPARTLCLIPAKGGSTRLPRKNLLPLMGKPLMQWAIDVGRASGLMDRIVISTEDEEVASVARKLGADVPFMRPEELGRDPHGVEAVAFHALETLRAAGDEYKTLIILLPTCPLRTVEDLREAMRVYREQNASFLMSVSRYTHTPLTALRLEQGNRLIPFLPEYVNAGDGTLPAAYRCNGAIHILDVEAFERERSYYAQPLIGYVMPRERSIDIDAAEDFQEAEALLARGAARSHA